MDGDTTRRRLTSPRLDRLIGYHLRKAQVAVFADFARGMAEVDLTPGQFGVLSLIEANEGLSQSELGGAIGIERSTVVGVIDKLERRGLVARDPSPTDRRSYALRLTGDGSVLLEEAARRVALHEDRIARDLSTEEREALISLLRRTGG